MKLVIWAELESNCKTKDKELPIPSAYVVIPRK